jgi:hypothetical protein
VYLDPSTKWPRKGKAIEHAQQKVKAGGPNRAPKGAQAPDSGKGMPAKDGHFARPAVAAQENPGNRAIWGFAEEVAAGHMGLTPP